VTAGRPGRPRARSADTDAGGTPTATVPLDDIDRQILAWLVRDGRARLRMLAAAVALSPSAISTRIHRLQQRGVLAGYQARLDPAALGRPVQAVVHIRLLATTSPADFERFVAGVPGVLDGWLVTGDVDYQLRLACRDLGELDRVVGDLRHRGGAEHTATNLLLRPIPGLDGGLLTQLHTGGEQ
jgi:Lrp/AsnC family transcriptional regulator, leucine-responsive regulatory protein